MLDPESSGPVRISGIPWLLGDRLPVDTLSIVIRRGKLTLLLLLLGEVHKNYHCRVPQEFLEEGRLDEIREQTWNPQAISYSRAPDL